MKELAQGGTGISDWHGMTIFGNGETGILDWYGMTTFGNDVYAWDVNGDIYKQTGGVGDFIALVQTPRDWSVPVLDLSR